MKISLSPIWSSASNTSRLVNVAFESANDLPSETFEETRSVETLPYRSLDILQNRALSSPLDLLPLQRALEVVAATFELAAAESVAPEGSASSQAGVPATYERCTAPMARLGEVPDAFHEAYEGFLVGLPGGYRSVSS